MTTALYRRYRPDTFAALVGQDHVTEPLSHALRANNVHHAYLFSGPRGCGKTTSARILARCLNCESGPTPSPCGTCQSCVDLARGGSGSIDVVEIDAASHNGVDDARDLRERAAFAPARDRYKVFILDEAHMVTPQGFNALLKLVEEPPPHVRFIFATTEPDKVIPTIRSRTHHYPFRLVAPHTLTDYLSEVCTQEEITIASGVLPLVVRASGGSVRDALSLLDQLIAGSDASGVTYERAIALLGFTDATVLDDALGAIAAADGASLFEVVERVIHAGHEPRRFLEDVLDALRDVILLAVSGDTGKRALSNKPADEREALERHARILGVVGASRAADVVADALNSMVGNTSPRLHLELWCARILAAHENPRLGSTTIADTPTDTTHVTQSPPAPATPPKKKASATAPSDTTTSTEKTGASATETKKSPKSEESSATPPALPEEKPSHGGDASPPSNTPLSAETELVRRRWDEVLSALERRRVTWVLVSQTAHVKSVTDSEVFLSFSSAQLAERFNAGNHAENLALAIRETLGLKVRATGISEGESTQTITAPTSSSESSSMTTRPPAPAPGPEKKTDTTPPATDEEETSAHDAPAPDDGQAGADVVADMLGGTIIDEGNGRA